MSTGPASVQFVAPDRAWDEYREVLPRALAEAGVDARVARDHAPDAVDVLVFVPGGDADLGRYPNARAVLSLWAGVEKLLPHVPAHLPLARMVEPGLAQGMAEWVAGHVLRHHLGLDGQVCRQDGVWRGAPPPLAAERPVTVLGLGEMGQAAIAALAALGFPVTGWSRRGRDLPGLVASHAGPDGLARALRDAEIVVCLLPLTPATRDLLDARTLAIPPRGFVLLNAGRGPLVDDAALLAALDAGQVGHATLDVFRTEPLPPDHPFWAHPGVTVTPHVAAATRPLGAARVVAENVRRLVAGEPLLHLVDRQAGY